MITSSLVQSLFTAAFIVRQIVSVPVPVHWSLPEFEAKLAFSSTKQNYFFIQVSLISSPFSLFPSLPCTKTCLLFSITTSFLLFSLQHNHHHISIDFHPSLPPPQFLLCSLLHHRHRHHHIQLLFSPYHHHHHQIITVSFLLYHYQPRGVLSKC